MKFVTVDQLMSVVQQKVKRILETKIVGDIDEYARVVYATKVLLECPDLNDEQIQMVCEVFLCPASIRECQLVYLAFASIIPTFTHKYIPVSEIIK